MNHCLLMILFTKSEQMQCSFDTRFFGWFYGNEIKQTKIKINQYQNYF